MHLLILFIKQYLDGKKKGKLKETIKNYFDQANTQEIGYYKEQQNQDHGNTFDYYQYSAGGEYNSQGQRLGYWIELGDRFREQNLVTNHGQYQNGQKVSDWDLCLIEKGIIGNNLKKIDGYFFSGRQQKLQIQVILLNLIQSKVKINKYKLFLQVFIQLLNVIQLKIIFNCFNNYLFVQYKLNIISVKFWQLFLLMYFHVRLNQVQQNNLNLKFLLSPTKIKYRNSIKIGKWIEINDRFKLNTQILEYGIYDLGGIKLESGMYIRRTKKCITGQLLSIMSPIKYSKKNVEIKVKVKVRKSRMMGYYYARQKFIGRNLKNRWWLI